MTDSSSLPPTSPPTSDADAAQWAATADYVRVTARFLNLPLDEGQIGRVATHLTRTRALAASLQGFEIEPHIEPAEIYRPAPFPQDDAAANLP